MEAVVLPDLNEIKVRMQRAGLKPKELARLCNIKQNTLHKYVNGSIHDPGYRTVKLIFDTLNNKMGLAESTKEKLASQIMTWNAKSVQSSALIDLARDIMIQQNYSQLPVIDDGKVMGSITEDILIRANITSKMTASDVMGPRFPILRHDAKLKEVWTKLLTHQAALIRRESNEYGIITKFDLLKEVKY